MTEEPEPENNPRYQAIRALARELYGDPVNSHERARAAQIYDEIAHDVRREVEGELLEFVESSVVQGCYGSDGLLDSMAISTWAEGIRLLAAHGRAEIIEEHGRRVIARLITEDNDGEDD